MSNLTSSLRFSFAPFVHEILKGSTDTFLIVKVRAY